VRASRSRTVGVLAAIGLVAVSAVGLRLSDPERQEFQVINGVVGEPVKVNDGEVTVTDVKVATALRKYGEVQDTTDGMFVVVKVTGAATGPKPLSMLAARLLSGDVRYEGYRMSVGVTADPGFQMTRDSVFEVDPARIDDLTLEMGSNEIIHGYQQRVRIKLGVTSGNAERWRVAANGQIEPGSDTTRAIP
jgi:hypothetical protein